MAQFEQIDANNQIGSALTNIFAGAAKGRQNAEVQQAMQQEAQQLPPDATPTQRLSMLATDLSRVDPLLGASYADKAQRLAFAAAKTSLVNNQAKSIQLKNLTGNLNYGIDLLSTVHNQQGLDALWARHGDIMLPTFPKVWEGQKTENQIAAIRTHMESVKDQVALKLANINASSKRMVADADVAAAKARVATANAESARARAAIGNDAARLHMEQERTDAYVNHINSVDGSRGKMGTRMPADALDKPPTGTEFKIGTQSMMSMVQNLAPAGTTVNVNDSTGLNPSPVFGQMYAAARITARRIKAANPSMDPAEAMYEAEQQVAAQATVDDDGNLHYKASPQAIKLAKTLQGSQGTDSGYTPITSLSQLQGKPDGYKVIYQGQKRVLHIHANGSATLDSAG